MGLDVLHYRLVHEPVDKQDFLYVDDWGESTCNVPLAHYERFVTDIPELLFDQDIVIIKNEAQYKELKKGTILNDVVRYYIGELTDAVKADIAQFIAREGLDKLARQDCGVECDGCKFKSISFGRPITVKGMYYREAGYQRRGMSNAFYDHFKKFEYWGKKENFERALECVGDEWYIEHMGADAVNQMRGDFKRDFVEQFVFGESLLHGSF